MREPAPAPVPEPEPEPEPEPAVEPTDLPTEAGLPIFDDENDDVSWIAARAEPAPPPPPFEEPPERPLFAPEPADGSDRGSPGTRRSRPPRRGVLALGRAAPGRTPATADQPPAEEVPGRNWLRLAAVIAACLLLLVAIVVAYNLGRGRTPLGAVPDDDPDTTPSAPASSASAPAQPIEGVTATDLDPQGDPPEENPELAPLAVDGDPETAWRTSTYLQNFGPGGLKTGVGLVLDLGGSARRRRPWTSPSSARPPASRSTSPTRRRPRSRASTRSPTDVADGTRARVTLDQPATGRFVTVWLTSLPAVEGGFRGEVAEVTVRG